MVRARARGTFGSSPALPRTGPTFPHLGPVDIRTVARGSDALQDYFKQTDVTSRFCEPETNCGLEPPFDEFVEHADDAVEFTRVEVFEQHAPEQIEVAIGPDREVRAVRLMVALQQEAIELLVVLRRIGHEIDLVPQRALVKVEVDRCRVAPF